MIRYYCIACDWRYVKTLAIVTPTPDPTLFDWRCPKCGAYGCTSYAKGYEPKYEEFEQPKRENYGQLGMNL